MRKLYDIERQNRDLERVREKRKEEERKYREHLRSLGYVQLQGEVARMGNTADRFRREGSKSYKHFEWKYEMARDELRKR